MLEIQIAVVQKLTHLSTVSYDFILFNEFFGSNVGTGMLNRYSRMFWR